MPDVIFLQKHNKIYIVNNNIETLSKIINIDIDKKNNNIVFDINLLSKCTHKLTHNGYTCYIKNISNL